MSDRLERRERRHLRWRLALFLLAIAAPSGLLLHKALDQLKWESLRQTQLAAEALTLGIDERLNALIREQDRRSFVEFSFLTIAGDPAAGFIQRSPLAAYPVEPLVPGLIAWFQVDTAGNLSTPLLPAAGSDVSAYGIDAEELAKRQHLERRVGAILASNSLTGRGDGSHAKPKDSASEKMQLPRPTQRDDPVTTARSKRPVPAGRFGTQEAEPTLSAPKTAASDRTEAAAEPYADGQALFERLFARQRTEREPKELDTDAAISTPAPAPASSVTQAPSDWPAASLEADELAAGERARGLRKERSVLPEQQKISASASPDTIDAAALDDTRPMPGPGWVLRERQQERAEHATTLAPDGGPLQGSNRLVEDATPASRRLITPHQPAPPRPPLLEEPAAHLPASPSSPSTAQRTVIRAFESELGPFRFDRLDSGHFLLYRWAWRDGARYVQGALIDAASFLERLIEAPFAASTLPRAARLEVFWNDGGTEGDRKPLATYAATPGRAYGRTGGRELPADAVVHQTRLTEPFGPLRLRFDAVRLPQPPGASVIYWLGALLALVLLVGGWMLYRLGQRQLALSRQQRDFVAAVSHELRTPLTSIRLYSEMLREGWAAEEKRQAYYRFIHDEAERLSRLVANVLQLARMTRDELHVEPRPIALTDLLQQARPTLDNLIEQAGFSLSIDCNSDLPVLADPDAFTQVLINLVDNSIKFAGPDAPPSSRRVSIHCSSHPRGAGRRSEHDTGHGDALIVVRDHGPGVAKDQRHRALALFQRLGNEATRDTKGTGIGLALVQRLMQAMGGRIALDDARPGLEVRLYLRVVTRRSP